jgi:peptide/nickel transport system ATP-binding protein
MGDLLEIDGVSLEFRGRGGVVRALEEVSLSVREGEMLGLVGESGSGKSVTAYALLRILDSAAHVTAGRAVFRGIDLLHCDEAAMRRVRGRGIAMIFQNPRAALNPVVPVGRQIMAALRHAGADGSGRAQALELMERVHIADAGRRFAALPLELSGGLCQRIMIALALAARPALLIADEPTTGLDVTTQAVIMDLIAETARAAGMATLLITHDLALAGEHCDRIAVMHAGHVVEIAPTADVLHRARHPYTQRLLATMPQGKTVLDDLHPIPGGLPDLRSVLPPCRYAARCERHADDCDAGPLPRIWEGEHFMACRHP